METIFTNIQIHDDDAQNPIIKVMGVGGGGSNAVNHMYKQGIYGVDFVVVNTDKQALSDSPVPTKIQIGKKLTNGRGAGNDPKKGREAALENLDEIKAILEKNTQMLFIAAGMGGGTGTGAAPEIAKLSHEMGILTVGIVTRPFSFEGLSRKQSAEEGIEELRKYCDSLLIISNDKIREHYGNLKIREAFAKADDILATAAKGIAEIITVPGYVNVDFEDVKTVMKGSGTAIMGTGTAEGEKRAQMAVEAAINSPLLDDIDLQGAQKILLYISTGEEELTMDEVSEITDYIQYATGNTADIIWGNGFDLSLGKKISVTIIATHFKHEISEKKPKPQIINMTEPVTIDEKKDETFIISTKKSSTAQSNKAEFEVSNEKTDISPKLEYSIKLNVEELQEQSNHHKDLQAQRLKAYNEFSLADININEYEQIPAFLRMGIQLQHSISSDSRSTANYTLTFDENNNPKIKENNSFLHNNID